MNQHHWLEDNLTIQVFAHKTKQRVVIYENWGKENLKRQPRTVIHDGRTQQFLYDIKDGIFEVDVDDNTFGLFFDGHHFQYLDLQERQERE